LLGLFFIKYGELINLLMKTSVKSGIYIVLLLIPLVLMVIILVPFIKGMRTTKMAPFNREADYSRINVEVLAKALSKDFALNGIYESVSVYDCKENKDGMYKLSLEIVSDGIEARFTQYIILYLQRDEDGKLDIIDYEADKSRSTKLEMCYEMDIDSWNTVFKNASLYADGKRLLVIKDCTVNSLEVHMVDSNCAQLTYDVSIEALNEDYLCISGQGNIVMYCYFPPVRTRMDEKMQITYAKGTLITDLPMERSVVSYISSDFGQTVAGVDEMIADISSAENLLSYYYEQAEPIAVLDREYIITKDNVRSWNTIYKDHNNDRWVKHCDVGVEVIEGVTDYFTVKMTADDLNEEYDFESFSATAEKSSTADGYVSSSFCGVYEGDLYKNNEVQGTVRFTVDKVITNTLVSGTIQYADVGKDINSAEAVPFTAKYHTNWMYFDIIYSDDVKVASSGRLITGRIYIDQANQQLHGEKVHDYDFYLKKVE